MSRVIHFEIHADDPERAVNFYSTVFGWRFERFEAKGAPPYWTIRTGPDAQPGIDGGLMARRGEQAGDIIMAYVCTIDVASVDDTLLAVADAGGNTVVGKQAVPGLGWRAFCHDTERNIFGILHIDPNAG